MAIERPAFKSFSAGEISPRMAARSDMAMYHHALLKCTNFNITAQGSVLKRRGWKYLVGYEDAYTRLFTFNRHLGGDIVISISNGVIRAFDETSAYVVHVGSDPSVEIPTEVELVVNGDFATGDFSGWLTSGFKEPVGFDVSNEVLNGKFNGVAIDGGEGSGTEFYYNIFSVYQKLATPLGNLFSSDLFIEFDVDYSVNNFPSVDPKGGGNPQSPSFGWQFIYEDADFPPNPSNYPLTHYTTGSSSGHQVMPPLPILGSNGGSIFLSAYREDYSTTSTRFYNAAQFTNITAKAYVYALPPVGPSVIPWDDSQIKELQFHMGLEGESGIFTQKDHRPYKITFDEDTLTFRMEPFYPVGTPIWDNTTGFPAAAEFFQGRLWLAATLDEPSGIWGSTSGQHFNFIIGSGDVGDGLYLPLATTGRITSITGSSNTLMAFTDQGEHTITSQSGIISSSDASTSPVSKYGSDVAQSHLLGDQIAFTSPDSRKLLVANFNDNLKNWSASDMTLMSHHMFLGGIAEIHDMRNPDYQIAALMNSGKWNQVVYDRAMGLLGWEENEINGDLVSMTVTKSAEGDVLWGVSRRSGRTDIVAIFPNYVEDVFLDYWVSRPIEEDAEGYHLENLSHLEGEVVEVVIDGALHPKGTVSGGVLRLQQGGSSAYVGLPYVAKLVTLPEEPADGSQSFSNSKRRNAEVTLRMYDSAMPLINGIRPPDRNPQTPMDSPEPAVTEDVSVSSLGWSEWASVVVEQDLPLNTEIVGIFTKLSINKR